MSLVHQKCSLEQHNTSKRSHLGDLKKTFLTLRIQNTKLTIRNKADAKKIGGEADLKETCEKPLCFRDDLKKS